jgi:hypothetical protein
MLVLAVDGRTGHVVGKPQEHRRVEDGVGKFEGVPSAAPRQRGAVTVEELSKPGDVDLEAVRGGRRRTVAPDVVDQPLDRNDLPGA